MLRSLPLTMAESLCSVTWRRANTSYRQLAMDTLRRNMVNVVPVAPACRSCLLPSNS